MWSVRTPTLHPPSPHAQVYESALSTSGTVEQPSPDLYVYITFERTNLLTWNTICTVANTKEFNNRTPFIVTQKHALARGEDVCMEGVHGDREDVCV